MKNDSTKERGKIKLFIMDDSDIFRAGLAEILRQEEEFELSGCGEHSDEAEKLCVAVTPTVLLMHASMREADKYFQIAERIKEKAPNVRILVISEFTEVDYLLKIIASGCDGYVHGGISGRTLKRVIRNLGNDFCIFDQTVINKLLLLKDGRREGVRVEFSSRERKIIELLAEGKGNSDIGKELGLAPGTVKNIISGMLHRCCFKSKAQLVNVLFS
ncbi:MAG: response regulator transcription factor [Synergistaceae bacterium]|jgi:DNA-binding NarL/FixJ family response regulator|nr:response regulator transcription factor [Synergistaceae bacterium]